MQTFLPYRDFAQTARVLDLKLLGKQRVKNLQIMGALAGVSKGWTSHPCILMWRGYEHVLLEYQAAIIFEWQHNRLYRDTCYAKTYQIYGQGVFEPAGEYPPWLGDERLHISHQSNLVRKDPEFYRFPFPEVPDDLPYFWPTPEDYE